MLKFGGLNRRIALVRCTTLAIVLFASLTASLVYAQSGQPSGATLSQTRQKFAEASLDSVVQIETKVGQNAARGSGFWVSHDMVVTCLHVVPQGKGSSTIVRIPVETYIDVQNGNVAENEWVPDTATVIDVDDANDLALLKVSNPVPPNVGPIARLNGHDLRPRFRETVFGSSIPEQLAPLYLAGYPLGSPYGIVQPGSMASLTGQLPNFKGRIKMLVAIVANRGNSGGPIFAGNGTVVGVLEGALPSVPTVNEPAIAVSGLAVVIPSKFAEDLVARNVGQQRRN